MIHFACLSLIILINNCPFHLHAVIRLHSLRVQSTLSSLLISKSTIPCFDAIFQFHTVTRSTRTLLYSFIIIIFFFNSINSFFPLKASLALTIIARISFAHLLSAVSMLHYQKQQRFCQKNVFILKITFLKRVHRRFC